MEGQGTSMTGASSTSPSSQPKSGDKRKKTRSIVWNHFTKVTLPDGSPSDEFCTCNYCGDIIPCHRTKNGTSSMLKHGKKCKPNPMFEAAPLASELESKGQTTLSKSNVTGGIQYAQFNQKKSEQRLVEMIIRDELPFRFVEAAGFRTFMNEVQPRFDVPGRKLIAKMVLEKFQSERTILMEQLAVNSTRVSITTDTWTSIQNINYMVITAHFLDSDWRLHKRIINFCVITSHKGDDIGRLVESCLRQWGIKKVFTITVDNASANDVAVEFLKRRLSSYGTLLFDGRHLHMRCACHIINLIVKDGIKELQKGIEAIWHCVKYIRSSAQRLHKFREYAELEGLPKNANVPLDVATRWNSTYLMLDTALKFECVFSRMAEEDEGFKKYFEGDERVGPPDADDWNSAKSFVLFLKKFFDATLKLSAWKTVTANLVFSEMFSLRYEIDKQCQSSDSIMKRVAGGMKEKFDKYWGSFSKINKIILVANVLDPRYKMQYHAKALKRLGLDDYEIEEETAALKAVLMEMYEEYARSVPGGSQAGCSQSAYTGGVDLDAEGLEVDDIMAECLEERSSGMQAPVTNEVDQYLKDSFVNIIQKLDVVNWWKFHGKSNYPILAALAKDVFAVPCSTVASENAFSLGSRIVDPFRASLTPKMVEALVCCSDWLRGEEVNLSRDPTEDELAFYSTLEDIEKDTGASTSTIAASSHAQSQTPSSSAPVGLIEGE